MKSKDKFAVVGPGSGDGDAEAVEYAITSIARHLSAARETAGLSQEALASKIGEPPSTVAAVEAGEAPATEGYVESVLRACGLPGDWKGPRTK